MSAGICIMNKNAVALAADSAVTVGNHAAIHNSVNKLFSLSQTEPVGVIIYSNAQLMQVPMEIIIKQYKKKLGARKYNHLEEYVSDFISFLETNCDFFRFPQNEHRYICEVYENLLGGLTFGYESRIKEKITFVKRELTSDELAVIADQAYFETIQYIDSFSALANTAFESYIQVKYRNEFRKYLDSNFAWLNDEQRLGLVDKLCVLYDCDFFRNGYVGVAIAGYGDAEIFPRMIHLHVGGVIANRVRYKLVENVEIDENRNATMTPLAQTDVMQTFLYGINDMIIGDMGNAISAEINNRIMALDDTNFAPNKKIVVQEKLNGATQGVIETIARKASERYMQPILSSVSTLPIEELSMLAESMINITSLRRKVALDGNIGTVGGPIDVAIISKGEGLIWMKRKHYFDMKNNLQFAYNHYRFSDVEAKNND